MKSIMNNAAAWDDWRRHMEGTRGKTVAGGFSGVQGSERECHSSKALIFLLLNLCYSSYVIGSTPWFKLLVKGSNDPKICISNPDISRSIILFKEYRLWIQPVWIQTHSRTWESCMAMDEYLLTSLYLSSPIYELALRIRLLGRVVVLQG